MSSEIRFLLDSDETPLTALHQALGVAMGSSVQIALLVTPFLVLIGWAMGQPMSLRFQTCEYRASFSCVAGLI